MTLDVEEYAGMDEQERDCARRESGGRGFARCAFHFPLRSLLQFRHLGNFVKPLFSNTQHIRTQRVTALNSITNSTIRTLRSCRGISPIRGLLQQSLISFSILMLPWRSLPSTVSHHGDPASLHDICLQPLCLPSQTQWPKNRL